MATLSSIEKALSELNLPPVNPYGPIKDLAP
jgi:hypothetical protein